MDVKLGAAINVRSHARQTMADANGQAGCSLDAMRDNPSAPRSAPKATRSVHVQTGLAK